MFYLLFICSCLTVCSEISFSESKCFMETSQFISPVHDLTHFCLMWVFTELNLRTPLRAIFVFCVPFYKPTFAIICLTAINFSITDILSYQEGFHLFVFDVGQFSLVAWRNRCIYNKALGFSKISFFCLLLSLPYGSIFCRLDLIKLLFLIISLILNGIMFFHFKKC